VEVSETRWVSEQTLLEEVHADRYFAPVYSLWYKIEHMSGVMGRFPDAYRVPVMPVEGETGCFLWAVWRNLLCMCPSRLRIDLRL
jgi:hypothetical protein